MIERAVDLLAAELSMDPAEVRRRNLIPRDAFLKIVKNAGGDTTTGFNFTVTGGAAATPTVYGSTTSVDNSVIVPIKSATAKWSTNGWSSPLTRPSYLSG